MRVKDVVYIKQDELGEGWGIVEVIDDDGCVHVSIAGGGAPRLFERSELRRPRDQDRVRRTLGLPERSQA